MLQEWEIVLDSNSALCQLPLREISKMATRLLPWRCWFQDQWTRQGGSTGPSGSSWFSLNSHTWFHHFLPAVCVCTDLFVHPGLPLLTDTSWALYGFMWRHFQKKIQDIKSLVPESWISSQTLSTLIFSSVKWGWWSKGTEIPINWHVARI